MASLNKVMIIGNLGRDPETRFTSDGGLQITTINVATSRTYRSQTTGQNVEETEWHRIVFFGKSAETIQKYMRKGSSIYVEGRLKTRKWEKDGVTHYTTEIMGENFQFIGSRNSSADENYAPNDDYISEVGSYAPRTAPQQAIPTFEKPVASQPQFTSQPRPAQPQPQPTSVSQDTFEGDEDIPF